MRTRLPIDEVLPALTAALRDAPSVVLQAPTGAGKTTRVPPALLAAKVAGDRLIVMLEPRRLAARAAARRMAQETETPLGELAGYQVRFEKRWGPATRILVVTEGILLRMLQDDPFLEQVGVVVFDEFHERSLDNDLALGMVRLLQGTVRPDLRAVVMSATLDTDKVAAHLGNVPIVVSEGRLFPVDIEYAPKDAHRRWPETIAAAVQRVLPRTPGDVLVFLPGVGEIRQTARELGAAAARDDFDIVPLYGDLPPEQQDAALGASERRRVVLATNVAETSVTVQGVTAVVDSGLARILSFDPSVGLDRLEVTPISQASADQRAGRAGRLQPGICVRLWSPSHQRARPAQTDPEVKRIDLSGAALQLLALGEANLRSFPWYEAPKEAAIVHAESLLELLGATRGGQLTALGRALARIPVHPRLGRLLVAGTERDCLERAALAAALLSERDPFGRDMGGQGAGGQGAGVRRGGDRGATARTSHGRAPGARGANDWELHARSSVPSDVLERVEALEAFEESGRAEFSVGHLSRGAARFVLQARDQLTRLTRAALRSTGDRTIGERRAAQTGSTARGDANEADHRDEVALLRALFAAFPDRLARRREPGSPRGVMVGGRGVRLEPTSAVRDAALFVCVVIDAGAGESIVRQASAVERSWLASDQITTRVEVEFDENAGKVIARRRVRFADLLLEELNCALPDAEETARVLADAAARQLERVLPAADSDAGRYLARLNCLREWMPELELPEFTPEFFRSSLVWLAHGCRSLDELRGADWISACNSQLTAAQRSAVQREAPERLEAPSGSRIALQYEVGRPPVLAVRIQEVFGWKDTPRIASGRVRVLLHLLGPNYRPQQVTDDLASFWNNGYPIVRKELRRRYPKHAWPEDPWTATAERRPQRRPN